VQFVSGIGNDAAGMELLKTIAAAGLNSDTIQQHPEVPSGRVAVSLDDNGVPTYDIVENVAYDFIDYSNLPLLVPEMAYFGSLIQRTATGQERLQRFLQTLPESVVCFYDINLRAGCATQEIVIPSLFLADILKLNDDELFVVKELTGSEKTDDALVRWLMETFSIRQVALTRGKHGSVLYLDGTKTEMPSSKLCQEQIVDTVGAGDAFAAMLAHCIIKGNDAHTTLEQCTQLAESVCTIKGAVAADIDFYETFI
jgi:fructokinase